MNRTSSADVEHWLSQLETLQQTQRCDSPRFMKPFHLATLAHSLRQRNATQLALPEKIEGYADTMNLWGALDIVSPFPPKERRAAGRYHPVELLKDEASIDGAATALANLFRSVCSNERTIDAIQTMLRELIGNCYAHSAVTDGVYGVICAQVWAGGRKAQIALADSGIGIRASLQQNHLLFDRLNVENSCEIATEYGVTGKPGKGHSGYGLAVARGLLERNNGVLYVRSGHEAFYLSSNAAQKFSTDSKWDGTLLVIEWDLDQQMDIKVVYESFPLPEGLDDDDFFI
ncbi:ATP-binding protein [Janthinobacterium sp.]|uniref:ATP-binding protein n=1 Tax=Janthinobacterium sp. TaxID=1871054 RepID=UPI00289F037E|nr:ATP-binding protein [Janthinobacterium sp.]